MAVVASAHLDFIRLEIYKLHNFNRVFHMTSQRPYWCLKTMKRRPCWCPKRVLWELNSFLMQMLFFVPINLHRCWPREWKHSLRSFSCCWNYESKMNSFSFFHSIEHFKMPIEVHRPVWWHYTPTLPSLDSGSAWRKCKPHQTRTRTTAPVHRAPVALSCSATPNNTSKGIGKDDY